MKVKLNNENGYVLLVDSLLRAINCIDTLASNDRVAVNDALGRTWKEATDIYTSI
jgi:hypothetical protein